MAFHLTYKRKRSLELIALVDMVFVLLIFFILAFIVSKRSLQEKGFLIPVPKEEYGYAQALIQLIDGDRVYYLDELDMNSVAGYCNDRLSAQEIKQRLMNTNVISYDRLIDKLERIRGQAVRNKDREYFIVIRSPGDLEYTYALEIMALISNYNLYNMRYGCVGGGLESLSFSSCEPKEQNFVTYSQKTMQIDFLDQ